MNDFIYFGEIKLPTKIAVTEEEQARGLMHQAWPPPVLSFPYRKADIHQFWMKNTPSPLDIIFCAGGKVVAIEYGEPLSERKVGPMFPTNLIVELPHGMAAELAIIAGTPVQLEYSLTTLARRIAYALSKRS